jgi:DeoR/GlpR family transcriptional regulator of sugar metabolism
MKHAASRERNKKILEFASEHKVQELAQMFDVSEHVIRIVLTKNKTANR